MSKDLYNIEDLCQEQFINTCKGDLGQVALKWTKLKRFLKGIDESNDPYFRIYIKIFG